MLRFHNADGRVGHKCQNCGAFHANGEGGWKIIFDAEAPAVREAITNAVREAITNAEARRQRLYEAYGGRGQAPREREIPPDFYRAMTDAMVYGRSVMEIPRGLGKTGSPFKEEKKKERVNPWLQ